MLTLPPGMASAPPAQQTAAVPVPLALFQAVAHRGSTITPIGETDTHVAVSLQGGLLVPLFVGENTQGQKVLFTAHIFAFTESALQFVEGSVLGLDGQPRVVEPSRLLDLSAPVSTILSLNKDHLGQELKGFLDKAREEVASG